MYVKHGRYRHSREQAEYSVERNKTSNRLEMLAMDIDGLYKFGYGKENCTICLKNSKYEVGYVIDLYIPCVVYTDEKTAKRVCELLNSGAYSLDGV